MLSWLRRRPETAERIEAKATALIGAFSREADSDARQRERQSDDPDAMRERAGVAVAIALPAAGPWRSRGDRRSGPLFHFIAKGMEQVRWCDRPWLVITVE